ncbi:hypothetical protein Vi05172_g4616 [Venturia inaequalis]|uniref:Secreted protein n=1 Tax=Venturia inaequalis TaxID=5025 RepID=A0A8H3ZAL4_VENIN|nr:hypothetical protein EG327_002916 [Venturia inaequalis]RDI85199.1 hypothetical protein Vi05172_g4616 [Venturia inaequalis]
MLCLLSTPIFFTLISLFAALTAGQIRNNTHGPGYYVQSNNGGTPDFLLVRGGQDNKIYSDVFLCTNNFLQGDCRVVALEWGLQGCLTLQPEMQNSINSWAFPLQVTKAVGAEQCRTYGQEDCNGYRRNITPGPDSSLELGDPRGTFVSFKCWYKCDVPGACP